MYIFAVCADGYSDDNTDDADDDDTVGQESGSRNRSDNELYAQRLHSGTKPADIPVVQCRAGISWTQAGGDTQLSADTHEGFLRSPRSTVLFCGIISVGGIGIHGIGHRGDI